MLPAVEYFFSTRQQRMYPVGQDLQVRTQMYLFPGCRVLQRVQGHGQVHGRRVSSQVTEWACARQLVQCHRAGGQGKGRNAVVLTEPTWWPLVESSGLMQKQRHSTTTTPHPFLTCCCESENPLHDFIKSGCETGKLFPQVKLLYRLLMSGLGEDQTKNVVWITNGEFHLIVEHYSMTVKLTFEIYLEIKSERRGKD